MTTPKQRAFAARIIEGANPSEAYRDAYRANGMSEASIAREAQRVLRNPNVTPIVEKGIQESMQAAAWCRAEAVERLERVNQRCFERLDTDTDTLDKTALNGFLESIDRLNALCFVALEVEDAKRTFENDESRLKRKKEEETRGLFASFGF